MKQNVGKIDRSLRIIAGIGIIAWGLASQNWLGTIGIVLILTGITGWCPPYSLLGINTCKSDS